MKGSKFGGALLAAVAAVSITASSASAQLTPSGFACTSNNALSFMGASACLGAFTGNDANQQPGVLSALSGAWGGSWNWLGKTDDPNNGPFTNSPSTNIGGLLFDSPITGPFVLALKAGDFFSLYLFNGSNTGFVNYTTGGVAVNPNNVALGLSHASMYRPTTVVPEPSTYALMATGLAALVVIRRRRHA
jgi:hypothetical protein